MRECRYWVAEDETRFDDENECIEYEDKLHFDSLNGTCACFNEDMREVNPLKPGDAFIKYLRLDTPEAVEWFKDYYEEYGYVIDGITTAGFYIYNADSYDWANIEKCIECLKDTMEKLKRA